MARQIVQLKLMLVESQRIGYFSSRVFTILYAPYDKSEHFVRHKTFESPSVLLKMVVQLICWMFKLFRRLPSRHILIVRQN